MEFLATYLHICKTFDRHEKFSFDFCNDLSEGTGLGLSLSYDVVTKGHGGEMKVESKEVEGAKFTG